MHSSEPPLDLQSCSPEILVELTKNSTIEYGQFQRWNWAVRDHKTLVWHVIRLLQAYPVIILNILPCNHLKKEAISRNRILQPSYDFPSVTSPRTKCQWNSCWTRWRWKGLTCLHCRDFWKLYFIKLYNI